MNPWEKYAAPDQAAPWEKYSQPAAVIGPNTNGTGNQVNQLPEVPGVGRTIFDQGMQGATYGFADDIADRLGVAGSVLMTDPKGFFKGEVNDPALAEQIVNARQSTQDQLNTELRNRPVTSIASNIAGGLLTSGAGLSTKAGAAAGNFIRSGDLAARVGKGLAAGAASGAAYGAGTGADGQKVKSAEQGAAIGAALGATAPLASAAISKLNTRTVVPTSDEIRAKGSELFQLAEQKGGTLKPEIADQFYNKVLSIRPQTEAGQVFKGQSPVQDILNTIPDLKGKPLSLQAAKEVDEALGDLAYKNVDKFGKIDADGKKFLDMQTALRRTIENADENSVSGGKEGFQALSEARKLWSTSLRLRDVERIINNAQYYEQPATALRTGFRTLLRNGDRMKGYSPEEVKAIKKAADTGIVTDMFRLFGSGLAPIGSGIAGTVAGGPAGGAAAGAVGYGIQQGSKAIGVARQAARADNAARVIAEQSGMVTQQPRVSLPMSIQEILKLPPAQARRLLSGQNTK